MSWDDLETTPKNINKENNKSTLDKIGSLAYSLFECNP
jgi:hypothetical protein